MSAYWPLPPPPLHHSSQNSLIDALIHMGDPEMGPDTLMKRAERSRYAQKAAPVRG